MKKTYSIFLFSFVSFFASAQINGVVLNKQTNKPIQYAAVELSEKYKGVLTDLNGGFILNDTCGSVSIKALGFLPYWLNKSEKVQPSLKIYLTPDTLKLSEIEITPTKLEEKRLGILGKSNCITRGTYGYQTAIRIDAGGILTEIKIGIKEKDNYRIRIYTIADDNKPDKDILTESLITNEEKTKMNLQVPHKGFFVAIEYLTPRLLLEGTVENKSMSLNKYLGGHWESSMKILKQSNDMFIAPLISVKVKN